MAGHRRHAGDLHDELHELFADLWQMPRLASLRHGFRPRCDSYRTADPPALHVVVELAGVDPASLEIVIAGTELVVAGTRQRPPAERPRYRQMEIDYGPFHRRIDLGEEVDAAQATARLEQGVLRIELPLQAPKRRGERVQIDVERR